MRQDPQTYATTIEIDQQQIVIRPIVPADHLAMVRFHNILGQSTVQARYHEGIGFTQRSDGQRLGQVCAADFQREIVYIACLPQAGDGYDRIIAVGRMNREPSGDNQLALVVADAWQHRGIGSALLETLIAIARAEGLGRLKALLYRENDGMARLCQDRGFRLEPGDGDDVPDVAILTVDQSSDAP